MWVKNCLDDWSQRSSSTWMLVKKQGTTILFNMFISNLEMAMECVLSKSPDKVRLQGLGNISRHS